jgi:hypothetical protein
MALQKDFLKDDSQDKTPESKNARLSAALSSPVYLNKTIMLIERVEEGETGWSIYSRG